MEVATAASRKLSAVSQNFLAHAVSNCPLSQPTIHDKDNPISILVSRFSIHGFVLLPATNILLLKTAASRKLSAVSQNFLAHAVSNCPLSQPKIHDKDNPVSILVSRFSIHGFLLLPATNILLLPIACCAVITIPAAGFACGSAGEKWLQCLPC